MSLEGHVENGQIVLDTPAELPEGAKVRVDLIAPQSRPGSGDWRAATEAAKQMIDYDQAACRRQRDYDSGHAADRLS